ncbi:CRISPR-associated protein Cas5 [bacterium HR29]|jgi:CRISPR-associated protein Cas5t|nr:CRISPR-associated protein Cas5 [bacterium HR29]
MMVSAVTCYVSVPIASFRSPRAREYLETLPVPPPATVYGMLCSAVGEWDRNAHVGAELAVGVLSQPRLSRVVRTTWSVSDKRFPPGVEGNQRLDFQELLIGVKLAIGVRPGANEGHPKLAERVSQAFADPGSVSRCGGLSLGESTHLVDELRPLRPEDVIGVEPTWLVPDPAGPLALPVWVDHVGAAGTVYRQFRLQRGSPGDGEPPSEAWVPILRPDDER